MSQDLNSTPASPPTDADTLAAARAVQHLLHGYAKPADIPTLSDIPVLPVTAVVPAQSGFHLQPQTQAQMPTQRQEPAQAQQPHPARHRAMCTCCNAVWETEVDLRRHPEEMLLCPRCAAVIRTQTEGMEDIERPLPQAISAAMGGRPAAPQPVHLDSLPPLVPPPQHGAAAQHPAALPPSFAHPEDATQDELQALQDELQALPPQAAARARPRALVVPVGQWALGGVVALLLLALGALVGYEWNEATQPSQAAAAPAAARPMAPEVTSTSGTAQAVAQPAAATRQQRPESPAATRQQPSQPAAAPARRAAPPTCPQGVAAMGLCDAP